MKDLFSCRQRLKVLLVVAPVFGACGEEAAQQAALPAAEEPPGISERNRAPTINGSPATSVLNGVAFSFTPTAEDADGDALTFAVTGLPRWATFNPEDGNISGVPGSADIGLYAGIEISVHDGQISTRLDAFSIEVLPTAPGSATLSWLPPTLNEDGSVLTELAGYKIYWGQSQDVYSQSATISNPTITVYVVDQLTAGTWYFTATSLDASGTESRFSNVASKTIQ